MRKPVIKKANGAIYCGLDLSLTATGVVLLDASGSVLFTNTISTKLMGMERLYEIRAIIARFITCRIPALTCVEGYSMGSRNGQAFSIGELGGVIKLMLYTKNIKYIPIPPTQVKKFATGKGNADKPQVMLQVYKQWKFEAVNDNEADAYVLAQIARYADKAGDINRLKVPQKEVMKEIGKLIKSIKGA